ncbi:M20 family metallopeptidase [soil metagenome]
MKSRTHLLVVLALSAFIGSVEAQTLSRTEQRIRDHVYANQAEAIALLEQSVNINSGTMTHAGVRAVGDLFARELAGIGFETRWVQMPPEVNRAGHLVAERRPRTGTPRGKRLLLIGHLDTVFEGEGTAFERVDDSTARGAGTNDMKGGDVVAIQALKALNSVGALNHMHVIVVFTGDEESAGDPLEIARRDLIEAARRTDVALGFESGEPSHAVVARRSSSDWLLEVTGRQAHSSGIFGQSTGYGAIFEAARIINAFREALVGQEYLTFGPGIIVGGTDVTYDTVNTRGTAAGKTNIVPRAVTVHGDLRALTQGQQDSARVVMRRIVEQGNLPRTSAQIRFGDSYPPMSPRPENHALLAQYDEISRALGFGGVEAHDPGRRGAADISFVAPIIPGIDGLGPWGRGGHTPDEDVNLKSIPTATARAAILMYRLGGGR